MDPMAARPTDRVSGTTDGHAVELSTEVVHERLRRDILRGALDPHEPISQVQLAKRLGVSRTPLREALRMLQREGLIYSEPNRRVRVAALTVADLEQLYAARVVVDSLQARLAVPRLSGDDVAEMSRRLEAMAELAARHDLEAWDVHHGAFHDLLKLGEDDRLFRIARDLYDHTERYRHVYLAEPRAWSTAAREHSAIHQACLAGDAVQASRQVARHLGTTALTIIALAASGSWRRTVRSRARAASSSAGARQPGQALQLAGGGDLVGDQQVVDAGPRHHLGLADGRAGHAGGDPAELPQRQPGRPARLDVRPQPRACPLQQPLHRREVALEGVQVHHQRRRGQRPQLRARAAPSRSSRPVVHALDGSTARTAPSLARIQSPIIPTEAVAS